MKKRNERYLLFSIMLVVAFAESELWVVLILLINVAVSAILAYKKGVFNEETDSYTE